jgi:hypothetical protein
LVFLPSFLILIPVVGSVDLIFEKLMDWVQGIHKAFSKLGDFDTTLCFVYCLVSITNPELREHIEENIVATTCGY